MNVKLVTVWGLVWLLVVFVGAAGQTANDASNNAPPSAAATEDDLTLESIRARRDAAAGRADLDEAVRKRIVQSYDDALVQLEAQQNALVERDRLVRLASSAPEELESIRADLKRPIEEPVVEITEATTGESVRQSLQQAEAALEAARRKAEELRQEQSRRVERRTKIPEEIVAARADLEASEEAVRRRGVPEDEAGRAELVQLLAERARAQAVLAMLEAEGPSYDARVTLLPARRDRADRQVRDAERLVRAWQDGLRDFTQDQLERDRSELNELVQQARSEEARNLLGRTDALLAKRAAVSADSAEVSGEIVSTQTTRDNVKKRFESSRERIDAVGLTKDTGLHLRSELNQLDDVAGLKRELREVREERSTNAYDKQLMEDEREELSNVEAIALKILGEIEVSSEQESQRVGEFVREILTKQLAILDETIRGIDLLIARQLKLDEEKQAQIKVTEEYQSFIKERVLWVRSVQGSLIPDWRALIDAAKWMATSSDWPKALALSGRFVLDSWAVTAMWVIGIGGMLIFRSRIKRKLGETAAAVDRLSTDTIWQTFLALGLLLLRSLPGPLTLWALGWALRGPVDQPEIGLAVGEGMYAAAGAWLPLAVLKQILHRSGVAAKHFRWPKRAVSHARQQLLWLTPVIVIASLIWGTMEGQPRSQWTDSMGRVAFILAALALSLAAVRLFGGSSPVHASIAQGRTSYVARFRILWYPLVVLGPALMGLLALFGYYYTAVELQARVWVTVWLVILLLIGHAISVRWLVLARRHLLMEEHRRQRERASGSSEPSEVSATIEEHRIDISAIDVRTRHLFRTLLGVVLLIGLFLTWSQVLPALRMLERVQLYPSVRIIEVSTLEPEAAAPVTTVSETSGATEKTESKGLTPTPIPESVIPQSAVPVSTVSLADVGAMLLFVLVTVLAVRNVPALLEMAVVGRLPVDAGARYAILAVVRYVLMLVGIGLAFGAIGIGWSKVQWLAAALTFGLAFGLQEIFANFVSGLIILAERPIRVGDTVTVQGVSGTVTKLRMRATTITDWDLKEMVIPNKAFITEQVINWTLSNPSVRLIVPVGVAYGSDVDKVEALLRKIAQAESRVVEKPAPVVLFGNFGDNALSFELRVYLSSIEHLIAVKHALHRAITKEFEAAGIEIAFPQRDLHIRSGDPLEIVLKDGREQPGDEGMPVKEA